MKVSCRLCCFVISLKILDAIGEKPLALFTAKLEHWIKSGIIQVFVEQNLLNSSLKLAQTVENNIEFSDVSVWIHHIGAAFYVHMIWTLFLCRY